MIQSTNSALKLGPRALSCVKTEFLLYVHPTIFNMAGRLKLRFRRLENYTVKYHFYEVSLLAL